MSEQYCIDWINSLDIPEVEFIDRIEDLYSKKHILLSIISNILNKKIEELRGVLGTTEFLNSLESISTIMNLYFDYNYDYSNKENLNKNTISLIQFLKSRYPKNYIINDKYEENNYKKKDSINNNIGQNSNNIQNNIKNFEIKNYEQKYIINNSKKDSEIQKNKPKENFNTYMGKFRNLNNYPIYNFKTTSNRNIIIENNINNKNNYNKRNRIINTSYNSNSNNNKSIQNNGFKKNNNSFYKEISSLFSSNILRNPKLSKNNSQHQSLKDIPKPKQLKSYKSLSSNNLCNSKKRKNSNNNSLINNSSEDFITKVMTSKIQNYFLKIIGKPTLKKDENFYYFQFPKITSPITKIDIDQTTIFNKNTKNNYYKFPFLLQNLMIQKNISKNKHNSKTKTNINDQNNKFSHINISDIEKKERLILDYLNKKKIISIEQKNSEYLWKLFIPDLKDGYIIGKLINMFEKKNKNFLKGITKETYYKINIYYNWQKIIEFLINRNRFNSIYLYQKNFYFNDTKLFNFLYDLIKFYYEKENLNKLYNNKFNTNISKIQNISNNNLITDISKNSSNIDKSYQNKSLNSTPIPKRMKNMNEKLKNNKNTHGGDLKMSTAPSISEIMNIRKGINYIHRENNSLIVLPNKEQLNTVKNINNLNKSEDYINLKTKEKFFIKGENITFDKNVNNIISFLNLIGINTSQINFYSPEMKIFKDGILLYQIISQLENNSAIRPKIDFNPKSPSTAINNHKLIINFLSKYKKNFPVEFTGKERELYKSHPQFILKFLNILKSIYNNEVYYFEKLRLKNKDNEKNKIIGKRAKINPKNIDKSERIALPLSQEMRNKFLIQGNAKIWA